MKRLVTRLSVLALLALLSGCEAEVPPDRRHLEQALAYYDQGNLEASAIEIKNALQQNPDNAEVYRLLAQIYLDTGYLQAAQQALEQARERQLPRHLWLEPMSRLYMLQGKYRDILDNIPLEDSDPAAVRSTILALQGMALLALQRPDEARPLITTARELGPASIDSLLAAAQLALLDRDYAATDQLVEQALTLDSQRYDAWAVRGEAYRQQDRIDEALAAFEQALTLQPDNVLALLGRASTLLTAGKLDEAAPAIEKLLQRQPDLPQVNYLHGQLLLTRNDSLGAMLAFQQVLRVDPEHMPSQMLLGILNYQAGVMNLAATYLSRYIDAYPDDLNLRKLYAAAEMQVGEPFKAVITLEKALKQAPEDPQLLALLGSAYVQYGRHDKGAEFLQKAAGLAPDAAPIRTQLALSYIAKGQFDAAAGELQQAIDLGPQLTQADLILVMTRLNQGQPAEAAATAKALLQRQPDNPLAHNLLGVAVLAQGEPEQALAAFRQALAVQPDFTPARLNLAHLAQQNGDLATARAEFSTLLTSDKNNLDALLGMAQIAQQEGRNQEALTWLLQARSAYPKRIDTGVLLVQAYLDQGNAKAALDTAVNLQLDHDPDEPDMLDAMGRALLANDKALEASSYFRKLTRVRQNSPAPWHLLATSLIAVKDYDAAAQALRQALREQDDYLPALATEVDLALARNDLDTALQQARALQRRYPDLLLGYELAGAVLLRQNKPKEAAAVYRTAYDRLPSTQTALQLSTAYWDAGDTEVALDTLKAWLDQQPDDVRIRGELAVYLQRLQKTDAAIAEYERVLAQDPDNVVVLNNLAWHYSQNNDPRSLHYAEKAAELAPDRADVADTLGWLLVQNGHAERGLRLLQQAVLQLPHPEIRLHLVSAYVKLGQPDKARRELASLLSQHPAMADAAAVQDLQQQLNP